MMIGRAIAAINCPGMFTIYDFHSDKAPKLKLSSHLSNNPFAILNGDEDDDDDDDKNKDPDVYGKFFSVDVGDDKIYIEDVLHANMSGWLPLHACCMSTVTLDAAMQLINEMLVQERKVVAERRVNEGKDSSPRDNVNYLDLPTINGPGAFNSQWTPLHMASAYGIEPLVSRLLEEGVNANTQNSYGYTPLLEACRRGYTDVIKRLLTDGNLDVNHLPNSSLASTSPFSTAPPQRPLAEATRAGFLSVVQLLLEDTRTEIDAVNSIGWTALHEACFYNRRELVQLLLSKGADASIYTFMSHAMPYHLTNDVTVKELMKAQGGPHAMPGPGDKVDMLQVLEELASFKNQRNNQSSSSSYGFPYSSGGSSSSSNRNLIEDGDNENDGSGGSAAAAVISHMLMSMSGGGGGGSRAMPIYVVRMNRNMDEYDDDDDGDDHRHLNDTPPKNSRHQPLALTDGSSSSAMLLPDPETVMPHHEEKSAPHSHSHSPRVIASEPAVPLVADSKSAPVRVGNLNAKAMRDNSPTTPFIAGSQLSSGGGRQQPASSSSTLGKKLPASSRAANGRINTQVNTNHLKDPNNRVPKQFVCELSRKIMTEPVQSIYGKRNFILCIQFISR